MSDDIGVYMDDVLARSLVTDKCWLWLGSRNTKGYGQIVRQGRHLHVHRIAYTSAHGEIPSGLVVDHLCHDPAVCAGGTCIHRLCVNPDHLAATTNAENLRRQTGAAKTHCHRGHPLSGDNLSLTSRGHRRCIACARINHERWSANPNHEAALIRAWAKSRGIPVGVRGRIAGPVVAAYRAAQDAA